MALLGLTQPPGLLRLQWSIWVITVCIMIIPMDWGLLEDIDPILATLVCPVCRTDQAQTT